MAAQAHGDSSLIRPAFEFGLGFGSSGKYYQQLKDAYSDAKVSGFSGWAIMHAGFEIPATSFVSVAPDVEWMISRISYTGSLGLPASDKFNTLFTGRIGARWRPLGAKDGPYLQGSIGGFVASSGLSRLKYDAKNPTLGFGGGVTLKGYELELFYQRLSVRTKAGDDGLLPPGTEFPTENFGGAGFLFKRRLSF